MKATFSTKTIGARKAVTLFSAHGSAATANRREAISTSLVIRSARAVDIFRNFKLALEQNDGDSAEALMHSLDQEMRGVEYFVQEFVASVDRETPSSFTPIVAVEDFDGAQA